MSWSAGFLILAVWADAAVGFIAKRRQWPARSEHIQADALADCACFIWAPAHFLVVLHPSIPVLAAIPLFFFAGIYRMVRFAAEGLVGGTYRGLPVTYNGYLIPCGALAAHYAGPPWGAGIGAATLLTAAALMVSSRLKIPEL